jgi:hypothetical protein
MTRVDETPDARKVYIYDVEPTRDDGRGTSGWRVQVVCDSHDLSDLSRIVRIALEQENITDPSVWTGIKEAKLLAAAYLDPRIAV